VCGIAGIVSLTGFDPNNLISMTHRVKHRGPDGFGFAFFRLGAECRGEIIHNEDRLPTNQNFSIGLGNRRLAILDLSALGSQPMATEDGKLCITFNGEIYNYLEVRNELEQLGHSFKTKTDTEVILHAYQEWGTDCLQKFNGMWSFALWDQMKQRLFCSRDRFGVKPFYYYQAAGCFLLASEIKQITHFPQVQRSFNPALVFDFLEHGILDHTEETLFAGVHSLQAGHFLLLDLGGESLHFQIRRYWDLAIEPRLDLSVNEATDEFRLRFKRAISVRLRSDVPVGSCLSGGLDSSSIVCVAAPMSTIGNFHTFSACFEDKAIDEREYITEVAEAVPVRLHLEFPTGDDLRNSLEQLIWHQDEPIATASVFAQWTIMKAARRENIPVLLDGQGGDETLCGYRKFYYFYLWHLLKRSDPRFLQESFMYFTRGDPSRWMWSQGTRYLPRFLRNRSSSTSALCDPAFRNGYQGAGFELGAGTSLAERQKADLTSFSLPVLLRYEDRNSMAHSIETRLPFLDYKLAEFLVCCPDSIKLRNGWSKWILRQAMKGTLPERVRLRRRKLGFAIPEEIWIRADLRDVAREVFASSPLRMKGCLRIQNVQKEFDNFFDGRPDSLPVSTLFRSLSLEMWARVHSVS